jgi:mannose-6-phosphate isomerase-like protein (cupin superfamily)
MINRIGVSPKDRKTLNKLLQHRRAPEDDQPMNYRNKVVMKPWGYEFLIFENESVAIWFLRINKGHSTSMHCHPLKKTCLITLSGEALCNTFERRNYLKDMEAIIIENSVFHSTKALSPQGIELLEIETPPNKTDLVRLNDSYGRETKSYEGFMEMQIKNLERFNYFYFNEPDGNTLPTHSRNEYSITMETYANNEEFQDRFSLEKDELLCLCRGKILTEDNKVLLNVGDAYNNQSSLTAPGGSVKINSPILVLKTRATTPDATHEN